MTRPTRGQIGAIIGAIVFLVFGSGMLVQVNRDRAHDAGASALANCQQIEVVKAQIRGTVEASTKRLPTIAYYRDRPKELREAIRASLESVRRFRAVDCYALPVVRNANIKRPPARRPGT